MNEMLVLMVRLMGLKQTVRAGWNKSFPEGHKLKTRQVPEAESVADHSWSLGMFAFMVGTHLKLDVFKMICMALVHDVAELVTDDIVTAGLDDEEKMRVEAEKRWSEDEAMRDIFDPLGAWGQRCYELWLEYANNASPEARALRQLDRLECAIQAVGYEWQGHQVSAEEFAAYADKFLDEPDLQEMMKHLRAVAG